MVNIQCTHLIGLILVAQVIASIFAIQMHNSAEFRSRGIKPGSMGDFFESGQMNILTIMFTASVLCVLELYKEPCGYFMRHEPKNFKFAFWLCIVLAIFWLGIVVFLFTHFRFVLALLDSLIMLGTTASYFLFAYKLKRQKDDYEDFIERAIELNSLNGQEMSAGQAHVLFQLYNYRKVIENLRKRRESNKNKKCHGKPRGFIQFKATHFDDYFQLAHWIHQIEQQEKTTDLSLKMATEMRTRLHIYDLTDQERYQLNVLAKFDGLQMPEDDWHCTLTMEPLTINKV
ncbi:hypothetical protein M3Y97_00661600 [Aphelenchoides bicaudatus]|nr:hypothetical protein M3Y97_00661600 [Aphelenchoides bicaudatus]